MKQIAVWTLLAASLGTQFSGCGGSGDLERTPVTGTVMLDGQPLPYGLLFLKGQTNEQQQVTQVYLVVRDGKFSSAEQKVAGPSPGENMLTLSVYEGPAASDDDDAPGRKIKGTFTSTITINTSQPVSIEVSSADLGKSK